MAMARLTELILITVSLANMCLSLSLGEAQLAFSMVTVDYDWLNQGAKEQAIQDGSFIVENNLICGIKAYKGEVYVTVPRWRNGVPATLNRLVQKGNDTLLKPYPSWDMNAIGNCDSLQYVQSMEIDPNTGWMWIIDTGRINTLSPDSSPSRNLCPPKLLVFDIDTNKVITRYEFPADVVSPTTNFMNDIVLDYVDGEVRYAYITDTSDVKLYVFDVKNRDSYAFQHGSMNTAPLDAATQSDLLAAPIDGIAMAPDFSSVYYSALSAKSIYVIKTGVLRDKSSNFSAHVSLAGNKAGGCDGMIFGKKSIFYAVLESDAVYQASYHDGGLHLSHQSKLISNTSAMGWVDTLAFEGETLWFVANNLNKFSRQEIDFNGTQSNMFIWKVNVGEYGYLQNAKVATLTGVGHRNFPDLQGVLAIVILHLYHDVW